MLPFHRPAVANRRFNVKQPQEGTLGRHGTRLYHGSRWRQCHHLEQHKPGKWRFAVSLNPAVDDVKRDDATHIPRFFALSYSGFPSL
jgi:hypothetical protein